MIYADSSGEFTMSMWDRLGTGRSSLKHTKKKCERKMTDKKNACRRHDQMTLYRCAE